MSDQWAPPSDMELGAHQPVALVMLCTVLLLGGTAEEADAVLHLLRGTALPYKPTDAERQIKSALGHVRSQS